MANAEHNEYISLLRCSYFVLSQTKLNQFIALETVLHATSAVEKKTAYEDLHWNHTCLLVIMNQTWMGFWTPNLFTVAEHPEMYNTNTFQTGCPAACNRPELCLSIHVNITIPGLWKTHNLDG